LYSGLFVMIDTSSPYITSLLEVSSLFISLFILIFAFIFLKRTEPHADRRPWAYLFLAVLVFFLFELIGVIAFFSTEFKFALRNFFKTLFIGIILYVFVYQYYLLSRSSSIIIKKRREKDLASDYGFEERLEKLLEKEKGSSAGRTRSKKKSVKR